MCINRNSNIVKRARIDTRKAKAFKPGYRLKLMRNTSGAAAADNADWQLPAGIDCDHGTVLTRLQVLFNDKYCKCYAFLSISAPLSLFKLNCFN